MILRHPHRPHDPNWVILADFATGRHELRSDHIEWLKHHAVPALTGGDWVFIRGMASHLGGDDYNRALSNRRAHAVAHLLRTDQKARPDHITQVVEAGEGLSSGGPQDNSPAWRSVEVTITPHRRVNPPRIITLPTITIEGRVPPRFSIAVSASFSLGPLTSVDFLIRDARRGKEARFRADMLGLSLAPLNAGWRGRWSPIPNDSHLTQLHDFHHARVGLAGIDIQRRGPGGTMMGPSATVLEIGPSDPRAHRIRISDFDAGTSLLPDAGGSAGSLTHFPAAEFPIGTFRD